MTAITNARPDALSIGQISRRTGVNIETIRYYERVKMLPAPARNKNGRRTYGASEQRILAFIRRARELGFPLDEVRALLALGAPSDASCAHIREIAAAHLDAVRSKLSDLRKLERILADAVAKCASNVAPVCPVLDILDQGEGVAFSPISQQSASPDRQVKLRSQADA
jgi:MerR family mercuric resistance operon transcriptional regulator